MPDMLVRLYALPKKLETSLPDNVIIRKPLSAELHTVVSWVQKHFSANWASEVCVAFSRIPCSIFIALSDNDIIGFACYDSAALGMFGPTGVSEQHRKKGIGKLLLLKCLKEMKMKGYAYAIIGAVGPSKFYETATDAIPIPDSEESIFKGLLH